MSFDVAQPMSCSMTEMVMASQSSGEVSEVKMGMRWARSRAKQTLRRQWLMVMWELCCSKKAWLASVRGVRGMVMLLRGRGWKGDSGVGKGVLGDIFVDFAGVFILIGNL